MYSTPPQYGVRGASINVVIENDRSLADILKGEISLTGKQAWYFSPTALMNLSYTGKKYAADLSYSAFYSGGLQPAVEPFFVVAGLAQGFLVYLTVLHQQKGRLCLGGLQRQRLVRHRL